MFDYNIFYEPLDRKRGFQFLTILKLERKNDNAFVRTDYEKHSSIQWLKKTFCFYSTPGVENLDWEGTGTGLAFTCFSYGAAVSEVEIDCLTGSHQVEETTTSFMFEINILNP